jgi:hypothetical protein
MGEDGTLYVASESIYESLALKGWLAKYQIQNINGVNMIPSRALIINAGSTQAAQRGDGDTS